MAVVCPPMPKPATMNCTSSMCTNKTKAVISVRPLPMASDQVPLMPNCMLSVSIKKKWPDFLAIDAIGVIKTKTKSFKGKQNTEAENA